MYTCTCTRTSCVPLYFPLFLSFFSPSLHCSSLSLFSISYPTSPPALPPSLPPSPSPDTKSTQWEDPRLIKKKQAAAAVVPYSRDYKAKYENFRKQLAQRKPVSCSYMYMYMYVSYMYMYMSV